MTFAKHPQSVIPATRKDTPVRWRCGCGRLNASLLSEPCEGCGGWHLSVSVAERIRAEEADARAKRSVRTCKRCTQTITRVPGTRGTLPSICDACLTPRERELRDANIRYQRMRRNPARYFADERRAATVAQDVAAVQGTLEAIA